MIPPTITRAHILQAIAHIQAHGVPRGRAARKYTLRVAGQSYPPKYCVALAGRFAHGTLLDAEAFGGGRETNDFLRGLGFEVVLKDAPLVPPSGNTIRIARVRLGLGMSRTKFRAIGANPWASHQQVVIRQYQANPRSYRQRIRALIAHGQAQGAQVVVLPACALVHAQARELDAYLDQAAFVVAGALHTGRGGEFAIAQREDGAQARFDSHTVLWLGGSGYSVMAAISSTVAKLHTDDPQQRSASAPPCANQPQLVLDVGHHPYGSRYLFNTLRCVSECVHQRLNQPTATVLAAWRYAHSQMAVPWVKTAGMTINWSPGAETPQGDTLDLIEVTWDG